MTQTNRKFFPKGITRKQAQDTGMALVLVALLLGYFLDQVMYYHIAIGLLVVNMAIPTIYKPAAFLWLGLSNLLGTVVSSVLLSIIFIVLVTPIGLLRRVLGFDSLQLRKWKSSTTTAFRTRDHLFSAGDIERPY